MAWKAPTQHLKKKELLSAERFYRLLGQQNNFIDRDTALIFYVGLVGLIGEELRKHKFVRLPHLGDFALVGQKARPGWMGKAHVRMPPQDVLKFYPKEKLRRYFAKRQKGGEDY